MAGSRVACIFNWAAVCPRNGDNECSHEDVRKDGCFDGKHPDQLKFDNNETLVDGERTRDYVIRRHMLQFQCAPCDFTPFIRRAKIVLGASGPARTTNLRNVLAVAKSHGPRYNARTVCLATSACWRHTICRRV